ncbi:MAG: GntR family transcriptional regulator [Eubacteriales bacterium]|jgi:DNA-binding GntR family transcriptional regulator|nr:GntR family transcriptional regulator [Eubacteriales bacterium]
MKLIDNVYAQLKQDIFNAGYTPNELIVERDIAEKYGVSKVTAGEALHRLCAEGHLTSYPRSGYMVTTLTPREMEQLKRMRIAVESLVIDIICAEVNDETILSLYSSVVPDVDGIEGASTKNSKFHMDMARQTGDKYVISMMETLLGSASRVEQYVSPEMRVAWQNYHKLIVEALLKRDAGTAKRCLVEDINQR